MHQSPYGSRPAPQAPLSKKSGAGKSCLLALGVGVGLFILLAVVGALHTAGTKTSATGSTETASPAKTTNPAKTANPAKAKTGQPGQSTAKATAVAAPQVYSGQGDKVVRIADGSEPWLATFSHDGSANFIVDGIGSDGQGGDNLVNVIGRYQGTVLMEGQGGAGIAALKIQADGRWTIRLTPPSSARTWTTSTISGSGDDVLRLDTPSSGLTTVHLTHGGQANFIVDAYNDSGSNNLVNEIGHYDGEVQLPDGTVLITVQADGAWTLTRT